LKLLQFGSLKFLTRPGTSDEKNLEEVILKKCYQRKAFKVEPLEHWADLGGYIGAFGIWAASQGAYVTAFEPFPASFQLYQENIKLNGLEKLIKVHRKAVVGGSNTRAQLKISGTGNYWRNSLLKTPAQAGTINVECIPFEDAIEGADCCKMDIEGEEFRILERIERVGKFKKFVYEHSFDIESSLDIYRVYIRELKVMFREVYFKKVPENVASWKSSWFPPCANIFCLK